MIPLSRVDLRPQIGSVWSVTIKNWFVEQQIGSVGLGKRAALLIGRLFTLSSLTGSILHLDQRNGIETVTAFVCGEKKRDSRLSFRPAPGISHLTSKTSPC